MNIDLINGLFELIGGALNWINVKYLLRDKQVKGVAVFPCAFFSAWGLWNLYYYPALNQWMSFMGGLIIVSANGVWVGLAIYYKHKEVLIGTRPDGEKS